MIDRTPEQQTAFLARKAEQKANRRKGKFLEQMQSAVRLQGRTLTPKEIKRQLLKQAKIDQKRMELLTKSKYPTPKYLSRKQTRRMF